IERVGIRQAVALVWIDRPVLWVHRKTNRAIEALLCKKLRQHRHRLFRAIFLIARQQHDFLSLARPIGAIHRKRILRHSRDAQRARQKKRSEKFHSILPNLTQRPKFPATMRISQEKSALPKIGKTAAANFQSLEIP